MLVPSSQKSFSIWFFLSLLAASAILLSFHECVNYDKNQPRQPNVFLFPKRKEREGVCFWGGKRLRFATIGLATGAGFRRRNCDRARVSGGGIFIRTVVHWSLRYDAVNLCTIIKQNQRSEISQRLRNSKCDSPVKMLWKAVSTLVQSSAEVSMNDKLCRSAKARASSVGTERKCRKSDLLPTYQTKR